MASTSANISFIAATTSGRSTPPSALNTIEPPNAPPEPGKYSLSTSKPCVLSDAGVENSPENAEPTAPAMAFMPMSRAIQATMTVRPCVKAQRANDRYMWEFLFRGISGD